LTLVFTVIGLFFNRKGKDKGERGVERQESGGRHQEIGVRSQELGVSPKRMGDRSPKDKQVVTLFHNLSFICTLLKT
jgi:hypothetical protein